MQRIRRLPVVSFGIVVALIILAGGAFVLNKWLPQPATYAPSTGSPPGSGTDDPLDYLPDTGLVQLTSPISTTSYYITNISNLYAIGYKLGQRDRNMSGTQDDLVVLDYGLPYRESQGGGYVYGVHLPFDKNHIFYNTTAVANSAVDFANGYHDATDATSHLTIIVGVNNCCPGVDPGVYPNHGARWAQEVINPVKSQIAPISAQVNVIAGMDIEMNFNYSYASRLWLDNYISQSNCTPGADNTANGCFFDFGNMVVSANGTTCHTSTPTPSPPPPFPTPDPRSDWSGCDAWYVSWGAQRSGQPHFARPLPEIYHGHSGGYPWGSDASAWRDLSVFSDQQMHAGPMFFAGSLTQRESCDDACGWGNNYPWEGFQLLSGALASSTTTRLAMFWSTDMYTQPTFTP